MHNYRKFKDYHIEQLCDPEDAKIYLSVALEDYEVLLLRLQYVYLPSQKTRRKHI